MSLKYPQKGKKVCPAEMSAMGLNCDEFFVNKIILLSSHVVEENKTQTFTPAGRLNKISKFSSKASSEGKFPRKSNYQVSLFGDQIFHM